MSQVEKNPEPPCCTDPRAARILELAGELFLEQGYDGASMEALASAAGIARQTLYHRFGSKRQLFQAVIRARCHAVLDRFERALGGGAGVGEGLEEIGLMLLAEITKPGENSLFRTVIAAAPDFPELARDTYNSSIAAAVTMLAQGLEEATAQGQLEVADSETAAWQFLSMVAHPFHIRQILNVEPAWDEARSRQVVAEAVKTFLARYGAPAESPSSAARRLSPSEPQT